MRHELADLIAANVSLLEQASDLLSSLDDRIYAQTVQGIPSLRIGAHLRHLLEFYECFLDGLPSRLIDYELRRRDPRVENNRSAALSRMDEVIGQLQMLAPVEAAVWVRPEDLPESDALLRSSTARELQVLSSHTTHHFALIAVALQAFGLEVDPSFGVAPSTLRYRAEAA
jgi:hypothetical protein